MKPEEQRVCIAEACGWKFSDRALRWPDGSICATDEDPSTTIETFSDLLPDYLNDLNAMHEAEKVLRGEREWEAYIQNLLKLTKGKGLVVLHATAAQRCEAFLRTLNLWRE